MAELKELYSFLSSPQTEVRTLASEYILGLSASESGKSALRHLPNLTGKLIKLLNDKDKKISKNCLNSLINLSAEPYLLDQIVQDLSVVRMLEYLQIGGEFSELYGMLLCNLTTDEKGCVFLLKHDHLKSLTFYKLVDLFVFAERGVRDPFSWLGMVLMNLTQAPTARSYIMDPEKNILPLLLPFVFDKSERRRTGILGTIRNLCLDKDNHERLLAEPLELLSFLLGPLRGPEVLSDEDMKGMPSSLHNDAPGMGKEKAREPEKECKKLILESLLALSAQAKAREILRNRKMYPILREYDKAEEDDDLKEIVLKIVEFVMLFDEPAPTPSTQEVVKVDPPRFKQIEEI